MRWDNSFRSFWARSCKKNQKQRFKSFAPAGATRALPLTCDLFEKRSIKNFRPPPKRSPSTGWKFLIDLFSKKVVGTWGNAPSRARRREILDSAFLWFFLWPTFPKKERKRFAQCNPATTHSKALGIAEGSFISTRCASCTKQEYKTYILCQNPHLTKWDESGRIFKVARAAVSQRKARKPIEKSQKFSKKVLKNLLTKRKCCDIIIRLPQKSGGMKKLVLDNWITERSTKQM